MALSDTLRRFFALEGPMNTGVQDPRIQKRESATLEDFAIAVLGNSYRREWQRRTVKEALGIPAILNAVTMISSVVGSLSMEVLRNGVRIDRPSVISRPNPLTTPQEFFRDVTFSMATRGESWLWIAKRDSDRSALALVPLNPVQLHIDLQDNKRVFRYGDRFIDENDLLQITYLREIGAARGVGPLQLAGAAVSVAYEAQEWAANFYADGGNPSVIIKHASELDPTLDADGYSEAERLRRQWVDRPNNVPRIIDQNIESVDYKSPSETGAQMLGARMYQNGEVANMFGIPGALLEYNQPGASLTYRNNEMLMRQFVDLCLSPRYLEPIEQMMSDLLPRNQIAQFDREGLLRADVKTQYDVAALGFEKGVLDRDEARAIVGLEPSLEVQPVPFAPPRALPIARERELVELRCPRGHLVGKTDGNAEIKCKNCGQMAIRTVAGVTQSTPADRLSDALIALANREQVPPTVTVSPPNITVNPPNVTVNPPNVEITSPDINATIHIPEQMTMRSDPVQMVPPDEMPQAINEEFVKRIEAAMAPKVRRIERDADGRMIQIVEEVA